MSDKEFQVEVEALLRNGILAKGKKEFGQAAALFTEAIIQSHLIEYHHGVLHGMMNLGTIWKLSARETGSKDFARFARSSFLDAVEYAKAHTMPDEEVIHAKFLLGQAEVELGNFSEAVSLQQEAYTFYKEHPRSRAHTGDVQRHLGTALVKAGNVEEGIKMMEEGLSSIRIFDERDAFDKRNYVWETGALVGLGYAYASTNHEKAIQFAQEALEIAQTNHLTIRRDEANILLKKLQV